MEREMDSSVAPVPLSPPLPSPGNAGGSDSHTTQVEAEAVEEAMCEPQNAHPRKAAEAAVTMVKLANVAAHAGHGPAACLLRLGMGATASKITRCWSVAPQLALPLPKMDPTAAKGCGSNINVLAHVGVVRALHGLFSTPPCPSGCPFRGGSAAQPHPHRAEEQQQLAAAAVPAPAALPQQQQQQQQHHHHHHQQQHQQHQHQQHQHQHQQL
eukprot:g4615.t1